ncbi:44271_t:CDS:2, partial [Gigaspora margarita]
MTRALVVRISEKDNNINWSWDEINWPEYDFIKDEIDTSDDELDPYLNKIKRGNITEEQFYAYFRSIKKRIRENLDILICANNKDL